MPGLTSLAIGKGLIVPGDQRDLGETQRLLAPVPERAISRPYSDVEKLAEGPNLEHHNTLISDPTVRSVIRGDSIIWGFCGNTFLFFAAITTILLTIAAEIIILLVLGFDIDTMRNLFVLLFFWFGGTGLSIFFLAIIGNWIETKDFRKSILGAFVCTEQLMVFSRLVILAFEMAATNMGGMCGLGCVHGTM